MSVPAQPFPLPQKLPSPLASVHHYWNDLIRAENEMPFADDVNLSQLPALAGNLPWSTSSPIRSVSASIISATSSFTGSVPTSPANLPTRSNFTVPSNFSSRKRALRSKRGRRPGNSSRRGYARILLPTWGDGRIESLLGAIA